MPNTQNPAQRIKGQEVSVLIVQDGNLQDTLTDIQNFNTEMVFETKVQGYLGEKNDRVDYIFHNAKFDMELNLHTQDWLNFMLAMKKKATRETPDVQFNITAVLSYPNGDTPTVLFPNVSWGPVPMNVSTRGDYVKIKLEGVSSDIVSTTS